MRLSLGCSALSTRRHNEGHGASIYLISFHKKHYMTYQYVVGFKSAIKASRIVP
jgi:hypothetical protein